MSVIADRVARRARRPALFATMTDEPVSRQLAWQRIAALEAQMRQTDAELDELARVTYVAGRMTELRSAALASRG